MCNFRSKIAFTKNALAVIAISGLLPLLSCGSDGQESGVMARAVPERADDFAWENELVAYRVYGEALEGETLSPGFDVWVKDKEGLVMDKWYKEDLEEGKSYHIDRGEGKDCYKVGVSLGAGASAPLVDGQICYPATNYRSFEILRQDRDTAEFVLEYPQWEAGGVKVSLRKKITVTSGSYFCKAEDYYVFSGADSLTIAAGLFLHPGQELSKSEENGSDRIALWEQASDQSVEEEDGMIGLALHMPLCDSVQLSADGSHRLCVKKIATGDAVAYSFGSCWSKSGSFTTAEDWFRLVRTL